MDGLASFGKWLVNLLSGIFSATGEDGLGFVMQLIQKLIGYAEEKTEETAE